jgi:hypothetical protein
VDEIFTELSAYSKRTSNMNIFSNYLKLTFKYHDKLSDYYDSRTRRGKRFKRKQERERTLDHLADWIVYGEIQDDEKYVHPLIKGVKCTGEKRIIAYGAGKFRPGGERTQIENLCCAYHGHACVPCKGLAINKVFIENLSC